jgi:anti-anti-sigma factor
MSNSTQMIDVKPIGSYVLVSFPQHKLLFDFDVLDQVGKELYALAENGHNNIIVSFDGITLIGSTMLAKLIGLSKRVQSKNGCVRICQMNPAVAAVIEFRPFRLFETFETPQEAATAPRPGDVGL